MGINIAPVKNKIARTPVILQLEMLECGAASLNMILAYYGKWLPLDQVRRDCGVSRDGSSAKKVALAAMNYGLKVTAMSYSTKSLKEKGTFPCIVHWKFNHFVVVNGFKKDKVSINDPARGKILEDLEYFDKCFTGVALFFEPGENFKPEGKPRSSLRFAMSKIVESRSAYVFILILTIIGALIGIIELGSRRFFMDRMLKGLDVNRLFIFCNALVILSVIQVIVDVVYRIYINRIDAKLYVTGSASFLWKLLRMPVEFYSQRTPGDLMGRKASNESIAKDIVYTFAPALFQTVMMVFYLVIMIRYHIGMAIIGVLSVVLNLVITTAVNAKYVNLSRKSIQQLNAMNSETIRGIELIESIKASGNENGSFGIWAGCQAMHNNIDIQLQRLTLQYSLIPNLINGVTGVLVVGMGAYLTMNGRFSVGMILAFSGLLNNFAKPAGDLIKTGQTMQKMALSEERIRDVMEYPEDEMVLRTEGKDYPSSETGEKLKGKIAFRHVTFGYARLSPPVLQDFSLFVEPGQSIAIVGGSGCGKSTVSKLLCGLYQPSDGVISIDDVPIFEINRDVFCRSVGLVDQEISLFEDTVLNNLTMWDDTISFEQVERAAKDACIHKEIMERSGGYHARMTENGKNYSGGQRQRMEIARVLANDPSILILDEATSALDAKTEAQIAESIRNRHITSIIIAHRLSTIRDCDQIIVLEQGKIVEQGKHEELYALNGWYRKLVENESC